jgi:YhcH/YjgK/YiaL family protein
MAIFGSLATVRSQTASHPGVQRALDYVVKLSVEGTPERTRLLALAAGETVKVDLGGGMFAIDAAYRSKSRPEVFFETHRKYTDVQAVLEGEESMEVLDRSGLTIDVPYDGERDLVKYRDASGAATLHARPGVIAVFFPADGHLSRAVGSPVLVRKCVVKVPVTE